MSKTVNINPVGFLAFFSFVGVVVVVFFYKIGNINIMSAAVASVLLVGLGVVSVLAVKNGDDNPALKAIFKIVLIILSAVFALFVVGALMLMMLG